MPLNLKEFLPEGDYIEGRTGVKVWVNPDIPEDLLFEFVKLKDVKTARREDMQTVEDLIKKILLADPRNEKKDVDDLFVGLKYLAKLKIITFIGELVAGSVKEVSTGNDIKTQVKKKDSSS